MLQANLVGIENKNPVKTVVVQFEASFQLGFLMETLADGRHVIFVPGVPKALVGTLHIVAADRVQLLNLSIPSALDVLGRLQTAEQDDGVADLGRHALVDSFTRAAFGHVWAVGITEQDADPRAVASSLGEQAVDADVFGYEHA